MMRYSMLIVGSVLAFVLIIVGTAFVGVSLTNVRALACIESGQTWDGTTDSCGIVP